jgi:hypothetical protein
MASRALVNAGESSLDGGCVSGEGVEMEREGDEECLRMGCGRYGG